MKQEPCEDFIPASPIPSHESIGEDVSSPKAGKDEVDLELARSVSGPVYSIFSPRAKLIIVMAVSVSSLISPLGATTFYPALDILAKDLHVTPTLINLSLTTYMVCSTRSMLVLELKAD